MTELEDYLVSLGATPEDLEEHADELAPFASELLLRPEGERLTLAEAAERAGVPVEEATRLWLITGFAAPDPDARVTSEAEVAFFQMAAAAGFLFGEEAVLQLSRVIGSSMARIADAAVSMFLVSLEASRQGGGVDVDDEMAVARHNVEAVSFIPALTELMGLLLRRHMIAARRGFVGVQVEGGSETQRLSVGFIDLVGFTARAQEAALAETGAMLSRFEEIAHDVVTQRGARLVKLIGDEVMFSSPAPDVAVAVAEEIVTKLHAHPQVPPARAGLAFGDVMTRDGDCFGPVVNIAARAVKLAEPSQVVLSAELRNALTDASSLHSLGLRTVKGIDEALEFWTVSG